MDRLIDRVDHIDAVAAAGVAWTAFLAVEWDEEDNPEDVLLHYAAINKIRSLYPWLDEAATLAMTAIGINPVEE